MSEQIGKKIASRLKELGNTQAWLAELAGVSINAVSKWTKTGKIARENIPAVAEALGMSAEELLGGPYLNVHHVIPNAPTLPEPESEVERLEEAMLIELFRQCSRPAREAILAQARAHAYPNGLVVDPDTHRSLHATLRSRNKS